MVQLPALQNLPAAHTIPHDPQLLGSFLVSAHVAPHCVVPFGHADEHVPPEHTVFFWQTRPHLPQLPGSFFVSTHADPHSVEPPLHPSVHDPPAQI